MSTINLVNLCVFASGLFPLFILIFLFKVVNPKYHGYWVFGIIFIMVAGLLTGSLNLLGGLIEDHAESLKDSKQASFTVELWLYIVPASIAAIGVNLISQYLTTSRPSAKVT
ncbi:hypothetical protein V8046_004843 [Vibrio parahaemolyticus]|uniref:hypothetical protein n=1 Tax=Vibrio fluvialis TaxID=676 RepID=UPI00193BE990|nr:hypothetical protein [Vibrio fluvialis]EHR1161782.1 hypothetical protein [Vibrio parahaemolyticus]EHY8552882.1 hypothetical protein [Vibrio parahaemolyticus]EIA9327624.1 hypothetical protein [Vibrio parahaemolyticus]ELA9431681.1 hypothetical protein [Vibrio parahaemolyticus]ELA9894915.1 hypothetical protein [Vibrio parahaemolyticus]